MSGTWGLSNNNLDSKEYWWSPRLTLLPPTHLAWTAFILCLQLYVPFPQSLQYSAFLTGTLSLTFSASWHSPSSPPSRHSDIFSTLISLSYFLLYSNLLSSMPSKLFAHRWHCLVRLQVGDVACLSFPKVHNSYQLLRVDIRIFLGSGFREDELHSHFRLSLLLEFSFSQVGTFDGRHLAIGSPLLLFPWRKGFIVNDVNVFNSCRCFVICSLLFTALSLFIHLSLRSFTFFISFYLIVAFSHWRSECWWWESPITPCPGMSSSLQISPFLLNLVLWI